MLKWSRSQDNPSFLSMPELNANLENTGTKTNKGGKFDKTKRRSFSENADLHVNSRENINDKILRFKSMMKNDITNFEFTSTPDLNECSDHGWLNIFEEDLSTSENDVRRPTTLQIYGLEYNSSAQGLAEAGNLTMLRLIAEKRASSLPNLSIPENDKQNKKAIPKRKTSCQVVCDTLSVKNPIIYRSESSPGNITAVSEVNSMSDNHAADPLSHLDIGSEGPDYITSSSDFFTRRTSSPGLLGIRLKSPIRESEVFTKSKKSSIRSLSNSPNMLKNNSLMIKTSIMEE